MSTTIESLELEILSSSQSAESGLDNLRRSLEKVKTATQGGLGLTSAIRQIKGVADATKQIDPNSVSELDGLAKAIQQLSGTKISSSIGNQITAISTALASANFSGGEAKITELVAALKPLESLGKSSLSSTVNALKKLPDALKKIDTRKLYNQINSLTRIFKPLADEMQKVANGFSAFPSKIQRLMSDTNSLAATNNKAATSYVNLYAKIKMAATSVKSIGTKIASMIQETMGYYETVNLFSTAMGKYAEGAYADAEKAADMMGIDPAEWMKYQGTIMTLATGFGVAGDRANIMSKQLTQLAYDISSFVDIPIAEAMQKLQSGFAGELEPLRAIGYDLSQAKLEAIALSLGIDKSVSSMTQAEKAQLRYYAIMTQVTSAQGDMAKTLESPANQMRIFTSQVTQAARAIGSIFIPILNKILPYAIAVAKVIRILANEIASLFGFELPEVTYSGLDSVTSGATDASDALDKATDSAKKLKSYMLGFDELNVINPNESAGSGSSGTGGSSVGFDFELPTYDFIGEASESLVSKIVDDMKEWLGITEDIDTWAELMDTKFGDILTTVGLIGTSIGAWKVATALLKAIDKIKNLTVPNVSLAFSAVGLTGFLSDLDKLKQYVDDIAEDGANFSNVSGLISEFAGLVGDALIMLGNTKTGGALKAVQGIGEIASSISSMVTDGADITNVTDFVRGLSNLGIAIGVMTGNFVITGVSATLQGITTIIQELGENWEAIQAGDWSGVDKATLAVGAIEAMGGILTALGVFSKVKDINKAKKAAKNMETVTTITGDVSTTTSKMTTKLKDLTKNLGLGLVAVAEVAAAAVLIVGAIWLLGVELENTGLAWEPVIENAETVATAIGVGTALLVTVGVVTNTLGKQGKTMAVNLGIGTAILLEIGVATALFIGEIWAIGKLLDEVGTAWQPVLDNGETIKTAIMTGTVILVAIGVVTAALGVATTATGYALPIAIGLGTAILLELGIAAGLFLTEIKTVASQLEKIGDAWEPILDDGDTIEKGIKTGTKLLIAIGAVSAALGAATIATGLALPLAIGLGTALLIELNAAFKKFTDEIIDVADKLSDELHPKLVELNKNLPTLSSNMSNFTSFMKDFTGKIVTYTKDSAIASIAATIGKFIDLFTTDPLKRLNDEVYDQYEKISDLKDNLEKTIPKIKSVTKLLGDYNSAMGDLEAEAGGGSGISGIIGFILRFGVEVVDDATTWWDNVKKWWAEKIGGEKAAPFETEPDNDSVSWWDKVRDWWSRQVGSVSNFHTNVENDSPTWWHNVHKYWLEKVGYVSNFRTDVENESPTWWNHVQSWWNGKVGNVSNFNTDVNNNSTTWWDNVKSWWSGKVGKVSNFNTNVNNSSTTWWNNVKDWWDKKASAVPLTVNAVKGWTSLKKTLGIPDTFAINFTTSEIKVDWTTSKSGGTSVTVPSKIYTCATGGFPDAGQMFIAREAGPELVGTIGSRNAVVNNDQIVESVSAGVYQAVVAALGSGGNDDGDTQIVINLDGEKIYENQQKIARNRGYNLGMGAFSFG